MFPQLVPWIARRPNQSILKDINPGYSLEGLILILKLKLQYFGHLMRGADSLEKTLMLRKSESKRRKGWQRIRWLQSITDSMDIIWANSERERGTEEPGMLQFMGHKGSDTTWHLNNNNNRETTCSQSPCICKTQSSSSRKEAEAYPAHMLSRKEATQTKKWAGG